MSSSSSTVTDEEADAAKLPLARYILNFFNNRNRGELAPAIGAMRASDRELLLGELSRILRFGGHPPNWVPKRRCPMAGASDPIQPCRFDEGHVGACSFTLVAHAATSAPRASEGIHAYVERTDAENRSAAAGHEARRAAGGSPYRSPGACSNDAVHERCICRGASYPHEKGESFHCEHFDPNEARSDAEGDAPAGDEPDYRALLQKLVEFVRGDQDQEWCQCCRDYLSVANHIAQQGGLPEGTACHRCDGAGKVGDSNPCRGCGGSGRRTMRELDAKPASGDRVDNASAADRIAELEDAITRCLAASVDADLIGWDGFAILQGIIHDGIPAPRIVEGQRVFVEGTVVCVYAHPVPSVRVELEHVSGWTAPSFDPEKVRGR